MLNFFMDAHSSIINSSLSVAIHVPNNSKPLYKNTKKHVIKT